MIEFAFEMFKRIKHYNYSWLCLKIAQKLTLTEHNLSDRKSIINLIMLTNLVLKLKGKIRFQLGEELRLVIIQIRINGGAGHANISIAFNLISAKLVKILDPVSNQNQKFSKVSDRKLVCFFHFKCIKVQ